MALLPFLWSCGSSRKATAQIETDPEPDDSGKVETTDIQPERPVVTKSFSEVPAAGEGKVNYSLDFFRKAAGIMSPGSNFMVSPVSAGIALSMLADGTEGPTRSEIIDALGGESYSGMKLAPDQNVVLTSANSAWLRSGVNLYKSYSDTLEQNYGAAVRVRDFNDKSVPAEINSWCAENTAGRIPAILGPTIDTSTVLMLLNALYFKAPWASPFEEEMTYDEQFHGVSSDVLRPFMHRSAKMAYYEKDGFQAVRLPYKGGNYRMVVILPPKGMDPKGAAAAADREMFMAKTYFDRVEVNLSMPKFKFDNQLSLNAILKSMGVRKAFLGGGFTRMTDADVAVSSVIQKCFIEVNEEGSEAAAVTAVTVGLTAVAGPRPQPKVMKVDRPFIFAITDTKDNIYFVGRVSQL